jgi:hypothetical protein
LPAHLAVVVCPTLHASSTLHHTRTPCTRNRTPHTQTYYLNTLAVILLISFVFQRQLRLAAMIVSQGLGWFRSDYWRQSVKNLILDFWGER